MKAIESQISITLANIITAAILPNNATSPLPLGGRLSNAEAYNKTGYDTLISNSKELLTADSLETAVLLAKELIA